MLDGEPSSTVARPAEGAPAAPWPFLAQWKTVSLASAAALAAILIAATDTVEATVSTWINSRSFNHGFIIPVVVAYIVWTKRERLARIEPRFEPLGLAAFLLATFLWLLGQISETVIVQQVGLIAMLQTSAFTVLGRAAARELIFPLFYLVFAIPFGVELVPHLQDVTAFFVVTLLRAVGIPVFVDGVFISTPAGNYLVAEACAGLRFLTSTLALGVVFAHLMYRSWPRRAAFIALSLVVPVIANGIRAFLIVFVAYMTDNEIAAGVDHIVYGWVFFSLVTIMLFGAGLLMRDASDEKDPPLPVLRPTPLAAPAASVAAAAAVAVIALAGSAYAGLVTALPAQVQIPEIALPAVQGATKRVADNEDWRPVFVGADRLAAQTYLVGGREVDVAVGFYVTERYGAKAISLEHEFAQNPMWKATQVGVAEIQLEGRKIPARFVRLAAGGTYRLVWYWYWAGGEITGSPYAAKLQRTKSLVFGGRPATAVIAMSVAYRDPASRPADLLQDFATANLPTVGAVLKAAASGVATR